MTLWWTILGLIFLAGCLFGIKAFGSSGDDSMGWSILTIVCVAVSVVLAAVTGILMLIF